jgi:hypothetical protein
MEGRKIVPPPNHHPDPNEQFAYRLGPLDAKDAEKQHVLDLASHRQVFAQRYVEDAVFPGGRVWVTSESCSTRSRRKVFPQRSRSWSLHPCVTTHLDTAGSGQWQVVEGANEKAAVGVWGKAEVRGRLAAVGFGASGHSASDRLPTSPAWRRITDQVLD